MYALNGPAALVTFGSVAFILFCMLVVSYRETLRGFCDFWDVRAIRNFFRSLGRTRFSLRCLLLSAAILPPILAGLWSVFREDVFVLAVILVWPCIIVAPLVFIYYSDCFGNRRRRASQVHSKSPTIRLAKSVAPLKYPRKPRKKIRFRSKRQTSAFRY